MAFSVNTNAGAFTALQQLASTNRGLETTQNRINTGLAVGSVRDDSSTFLIAQNQRSDLSGLSAVSSSLSRTSSTLDVAVNAAESVSDLLNEAREIAVSAQDVGLDAASLDALNRDFSALVGQIDSIVSQAEFNGVNLVGDNPDNAAAITGVNRASEISTLSVGGVDLTTDGASATTASAFVSGTVTLDNTLITDAATFDSEFASNTDVLQAVVDGGLDTNGVIAVDGSGNATGLDFANSSAILTDGATNGDDDTVAFDVGGATITLTFNDGTTGTTLADADGATFTAAAVSGTQDIDNVANATELTDVTLSEINLTQSSANREAAVAVVDNFFNNLQTELARFGSASQQIDLQAEFTSNLSDSVEVGIGNLVDADLARESANLQSLQVQQQLGLQALAIANRSPQSILSLFG